MTELKHIQTFPTQSWHNLLWQAGLLSLGIVVGGVVINGLTGVVLSWTDTGMAWAACWLTSLIIVGGVRAGAGRLPVALGFLAGLTSAALLVVVLTGWTPAAWLLLAAWWVWLMLMDRFATIGRTDWARLVLHGGYSLVAGLSVAVGAQMAGGYAEEESFVAVQALLVTGFWFFLRWVALGSFAGSSPPVHSRRAANWAVLISLVALTAGSGVAVRTYQSSFYDPQAPAFAGITPEQPFLCTQVAGDAETFDGESVFADLMARVADNPPKDLKTPELGMLALGTGEKSWADAFRQAILADAAAQAFTGPANSLKYEQYLAAMRAYYYPPVAQRFPDLFSPEERVTLQAWFAAVNRRVLTPEWSDWVYAVAMRQWPKGPYINQEIGAGALAVLTSTGLADPGLAAQNQAYLDQSNWGWGVRFRNTDDAYIYQPEWITNAMFLAQAGRTVDEAKRRLAFRWLLVQALPDGGVPYYNYPFWNPAAASAYLGAIQLNDPEFVWLAGKSLRASHTNSGSLSWMAPK